MNAASIISRAPVIAFLKRPGRFFVAGAGFPRAAFWLSVGLLSWGLSDWTWTLAQPFFSKPAVSARSITPGRASDDLSPLLSAHLFGQAAGGDGRATALADVPKTGLNLVLTGVMAAGEGGLAFIGVDGRPADSFAVGQEIIPGVSLKAIYADRAIIERGGVSESLIMDGADVVPALPAASGAIQKTDRNRFSIPRAAVKAEMSSASLLSQAKIVPGKDGGFVVSSVQAGSVLETLGLQAGQTIESVNGKPLHSTEDMLKLFSDFNSLSQIQIGIVKDGKRDNLTYDLR